MFQRFLGALDGSRPIEPLEGPAEDRRYLADRLARFGRVLRRWPRPPADPAGRLLLAQDLFDAGLFFDAHEYLEPYWKRAAGIEKLLLKGVIQAAAAVHKLELSPGRVEGPLWSLGNAARWLERAGAPAEAVSAVREIRRRLEERRLDLGDLPPLRVL